MLKSQPSIIGYLELSHNKYPKNELKYLLNTIQSVCYPESRGIINKQNKDGYKQLLGILETNKKYRFESNILENNDEIVVFHRQWP